MLILPALVTTAMAPPVTTVVAQPVTTVMPIAMQRLAAPVVQAPVASTSFGTTTTIDGTYGNSPVAALAVQSV